MSNSSPKIKRGGKEPSQGVIGIDEVGRGPLAGPVTVCAVYIETESTYKALKDSLFSGSIKDSKKLLKCNRDNMFRMIRKNREFKKSLKYSISSRSANHIDRYGIQHSIRACISSCVTNLAKQGVAIDSATFRLDAGLIVPVEGIQQQSFIKGDEKYLEIALASILAKVTRDTYMERLAQGHKEYGWEKNVGYGTAAHRRAIEKYGITKYHRTTYLKAFG